MHSLDTVKTRQQGDPHMPPKYTSMGSTYYTIWRQEGIKRGLYGGVAPAFLGSFSGTVIFFGTYEWSKRKLIDSGVAPSISYFTAGKFALFILTLSCIFRMPNFCQALLQISQPPRFMYHPKSSKPASNSKVDTTTPTSTPAIIINLQFTLLARSSKWKVFPPSSMDTKQPCGVISHSLLSNSRFTNKSRSLQRLVLAQRRLAYH